VAEAGRQHGTGSAARGCVWAASRQSAGLLHTGARCMLHARIKQLWCGRGRWALDAGDAPQTRSSWERARGEKVWERVGIRPALALIID
jgi:hypothetical protein